MISRLVIVESPAKAKTIKKYLGKGYQVLASYGHVRDLIPKEGAVDPQKDFAMKYELIERNAKHVKAISDALKQHDELLLATDPDREGEAISFHLCELMQAKGLLKNKTATRVVFHEITKTAILEAIENPRGLSMDLVNAQQARRALDYLVGFNLSPLLWRKVRPGLSAGRVQSPALRLIVERELAIEKFQSQEYWTIEAELTQKSEVVATRLIEYQSKKLKQFSITQSTQANKTLAELKALAQEGMLITKVDKKTRKRNPSPPFTTSTLQQEASRKLGFGAQKTMRVAQQLYEGMDIGEGTTGLISYMRTDSMNLAVTAIDDIRALIHEKYGAHCLPTKARVFKTKAKNVQEAHEAIRPTFIARTPEELKAYLSAEQFKLYSLIWKRTVACQMAQALVNTVAVDLQCGSGNIFRANGSVVAEPGFLQVYEESLDDTKKENEKRLPTLAEGDILPLKEMRALQHFTDPPPRFTEASLVKTLEEYGIGRPSTYASIISTLQQRDYAHTQQKRFFPTDVGRVVNRFLTTYFERYVDYGFTAALEDQLDEISRGELASTPLLAQFWTPFIELVQDIEKNVQRKDVTQEALDEQCPQCQAPLSIRLGRRGRFIGCTDYPKCDYTRSLDNADDATQAPEIVADRSCPKCEQALHIKVGKYGKFIGCSSYPKCKHIESLTKPEDTKVACPKCQPGTILKRKARSGKTFYSCAQYPKCTYALWYEPLPEPCPECQWPITMLKVTKRRGTERACPQKECNFTLPYEAKD